MKKEGRGGGLAGRRKGGEHAVHGVRRRRGKECIQEEKGEGRSAYRKKKVRVEVHAGRKRGG